MNVAVDLLEMPPLTCAICRLLPLDSVTRALSLTESIF